MRMHACAAAVKNRMLILALFFSFYLLSPRTTCLTYTFSHSSSNVTWLWGCFSPIGYYCPPGSTHVDQHRCGGVHVFCPQGSHEPIPVSAGYYTVSASRVSIDPRELRLGEGIGRGARAPGGGGSSRTGAEVAAHVEWSETRGSQELCAPGTYCVGGVAQVCPQVCVERVHSILYLLLSPACPTIASFDLRQNTLE